MKLYDYIVSQIANFPAFHPAWSYWLHCPVMKGGLPNTQLCDWLCQQQWQQPGIATAEEEQIQVSAVTETRENSRWAELGYLNLASVPTLQNT